LDNNLLTPLPSKVFSLLGDNHRLLLEMLSYKLCYFLKLQQECFLRDRFVPVIASTGLQCWFHNVVQNLQEEEKKTEKMEKEK
jgi:hypothetical protein